MAVTCCKVRLARRLEGQGEVRGNEVMEAVLIDRMLHDSHIANIRGTSYRMRQHVELWRALNQESPDGYRGMNQLDTAREFSSQALNNGLDSYAMLGLALINKEKATTRRPSRTARGCS